MPIPLAERHTAGHGRCNSAVGMLKLNSWGIPVSLGISKRAPVSERSRNTQLKALPGNSMIAALKTRRRRTLRFSMTVRLRRTDEKFLKLVAESPALVLASMQGSGNHANDDVGQCMWNLGPLVNVLSLNTVISSA
jgi:hypothetical protein